MKQSVMDITLPELEQAARFILDTVPPTPQYAWTMKNLQSNDFMLGVRWNLWEPQAPLVPLVRKG